MSSTSITTILLSPLNLLIRFMLDGLRLTRALSLRNYIRLAYHLVLKRPPDRAGLLHHRRQILERGLPAAWVFESLLNSPEYRKSINPEHYVRMQLVRGLPAAQVIVDLGGGARDLDEGALYAMGYPHRWQRLVIVDLPPGDRYPEWRKAAERTRVETAQGPVEYVYGSATDPQVIPEAGFADLVWSGNVIEHVSEADGEGMLALAHRVLKPGGCFCLDTPNRRITRLVYGDRFCNPDHRFEYTHDQLSGMLRRHGFEIVEQRGVLDCRAVVAGAPYNLRTQLACPEFTDRVEDGYFLYYRARKL